MRKYLPSVGLLFLAAVFLFGATRSSKLACDRTTCTYNDRSFAVASVREVRFIDKLGKNKNSAESALVFANGTEMRVGHGDVDDARAIHAQLVAFFSPGGPARFEMTSKGPWWSWLAAIAALAGALGVGVHRHRHYTPPPKVKSARGAFARKRVIVFGLAIGVALIGVQLGIMYFANKSQGTLELVCEQRCKFQEMECLPGGKVTQMLDPGTYTIEIWASSGSALWIPKQFEIAVGETTQFVCR